MSLLEAPIDTKLRVLEILSNSESRRKLNSLGMHENDYLIKLNDTKWGPVLIRNFSNGSGKIALGRSLATSIIVSE